MKIEIRKNPAIKQRWHFRILARNGKVLATSENYLEQRKCEHAARKIADSCDAWEIIVK